MSKQVEVQFLSRGPDGGNPTPRRQRYVSQGSECGIRTPVVHREGVAERSRRCAAERSESEDS